jgi:hypothetical protein
MGKTWKEIKKRGNKHYHGAGTQPIDLFKDTQPHPSLTALDVFALCNNIKYSYRQLTRGISDTDCEKILHYTEMATREDK